MATPVLCSVALHLVLVGAEEDAPVVLDTGQPQRQHGGAVAAAKVHRPRLGLVTVPVQEPELIPPNDAELAVAKLHPKILSDKNISCKTHIKLLVGGGGDLHEAVVAVGGGHAGEHQVGEAEGDLARLGQHEAAAALVLHVPPQPGGGQGQLRWVICNL